MLAAYARGGRINDEVERFLVAKVLEPAGDEVARRFELLDQSLRALERSISQHYFGRLLVQKRRQNSAGCATRTED